LEREQQRRAAAGVSTDDPNAVVRGCIVSHTARGRVWVYANILWL
jgi:hypothetical protein